MRLLLAGDDLIWRKGLFHLLKSNGCFSAFHECSSRTDCLTVFARERPNVVLIRCASDCMCCLELVEHLLAKHRDARILMIAEQVDVVTARRLLDMGVLGIVNQVESGDLIDDAISRVSKGFQFVNDNLAIRLANAGTKPKNSPFATLTLREYEVFSLIVAGKHTQDIAHMLNISGKTVSNHHSSIRGKLDVSNDVGLLRLAIRHGMTSA